LGKINLFDWLTSFLKHHPLCEVQVLEMGGQQSKIGRLQRGQQAVSPVGQDLTRFHHVLSARLPGPENRTMN
jgi:hypothetical protein